MKKIASPFSFKKFKNQQGFTLLEILLVVAAIAILAGIVILAINPAKQLGDTRNAQRKVDVNTILNAIYQYAIDHNGALPGDTPTIPNSISIPESTTTVLPICYQHGTETLCDNADWTSSPVSAIGTAVEIQKFDTSASECDQTALLGLVDICTDLTTDGTYLVGLPVDPSIDTDADPAGTGYWIYKDANNRITIVAPYAEQTQGATKIGISVTR